MAALAALTGSVLVSFVVSLANLEMDLTGIFRLFNYLSMGLGSIYAAKYVRRMGWLTGALTACLYLIALTFWVEGDIDFLLELKSAWLSEAGIAALIGLIGGILGVNLAG